MAPTSTEAAHGTSADRSGLSGERLLGCDSSLVRSKAMLLVLLSKA